MAIQTLALGNGVLLFGFFALVAVLAGYAIWFLIFRLASSDRRKETRGTSLASALRPMPIRAGSSVI